LSFSNNKEKKEKDKEKGKSDKKRPFINPAVIRELKQGTVKSKDEEENKEYKTKGRKKNKGGDLEEGAENSEEKKEVTGEKDHKKAERPPRKIATGGETSGDPTGDGEPKKARARGPPNGDRPPRKYPPSEVIRPHLGTYEPASLDDVLAAIGHHNAK